MSSVLPEVIESIPTENDDENMDISIDDENDEEEEVVEVVEKEVIPQEVIFKEAPSVKPVVKKKRVMSEKQLENLKKAREKSNQLRKERKAQREQEAKQIIKEKKEEYVKKKVEKAIRQNEISIDKEQVLVNNVNTNISHDDIQNIVSQSILKYDTQKKQEKADKKKKKAEEEEKQRINNTIRRAQGQQPALQSHEAGYFSQCF